MVESRKNRKKENIRDKERKEKRQEIKESKIEK